ncbi:Platelet-activating factor acetylhydrolase protein [Sarcoptes scabiei]|nr:Platelet-activating factor acetylhydrolase protein [Sarcoptes scabiei]
MSSSRMDFNEILEIKDPTKRNGCLQMFLRELQTNDYDINLVLESLAEKILSHCSSMDLILFENLFFQQISWRTFLFNTTADIKKQLNVEKFIQFLIDYFQAFPNRIKEHLNIFSKLFKGDPNRSNEMKLSCKEIECFNSFTFVLRSINRSFYIVEFFRNRFPFFHNSCVHDFVCFSYNMLNTFEYMRPKDVENVIGFLIQKLLEIDYEQFFVDLNDLNKENQADTSFIFDIETNDSGIEEQIKKAKTLEAILLMFFEFIDEKIIADDVNVERLKIFQKIFLSLFIKHIIQSNSVHCQFLIFYLCGKTNSFLDAIFEDLYLSPTNQNHQNLYFYLNFITSLILNGKFIKIDIIFRFISQLLSDLNYYVSRKQEKENSNQLDDLLFYENAINFCKIFCTFHNEFTRNQIEFMKNLNLKQILFNDCLKPLEYFPNDLRHRFVHLASYYRIGYVNLKEIVSKNLEQTFSNLFTWSCSFGTIYFKSIRIKIEPFLRENNSVIGGKNHSFENEIDHRKREDSIVFGPDLNESIEDHKKIFSYASSPNYTSASDDAMMLSTSNNFNKFLLKSMKSDIEMSE